MEMATKKKVLFKVIIIGGSDVGKTCLMHQYVNKKFTELYDATIEPILLRKEIVVGDRIVMLQVSVNRICVL